MSVLSRWRQRRTIRAGLLKDARAQLAARKTKANVAKVKVRREQVDFADRVIARHDRALVATPIRRILSSSWGYHPGVHDGVDLICEEDAPCYAICDGTVVDVRSGGWWGKGAPADPALREKGNGIIQIRCDVDAGPFRKGLVFAYGHAEKATVKVGDKVHAGDQVGHAGFANAWHLHFMVHAGGHLRGIGDRDPPPFVRYAIERER
jgi:murein DD-endopeptidase MepM/ murein hydrolase activator NlpD